jgi:hypothetical protein
MNELELVEKRSLREELQGLLSSYSEWNDDKQWYNPYFETINDLILFSENNFEILVDNE